nr:hypothetical protein DM860_012227 [Ipomoea batatas]
MATSKSMMLTCGIFLALLFSFGVHISHERPLNKAPNFLPNNVHGSHSLRHHDDHKVGPSDDDSDGGAYGFVTGTNPGHSPGVGHSGGFQTIGSNV